MSSPPTLSFRGVRLAFDGAAPIVDGLSCEVPLDGLTFVVGKSGSGKSVLCRLAVGLLRPSAGEVDLLGVDVHRAPERQLRALRARAPYLVQGPALLDWLTLAENVGLAGQRGNPGAGTEVANALARVGLAEHAHAYPPAVGPGLKKRAAIARALVMGPEVLLLDEPTTGLDRGATAQVNGAIAVLRREGLGALVVSHDYASLGAMADRVLLVANGRAKLFGSRDGFFSSDDPEVRALLSAASPPVEVRDG